MAQVILDNVTKHFSDVVAVVVAVAVVGGGAVIAVTTNATKHDG